MKAESLFAEEGTSIEARVMEKWLTDNLISIVTLLIAIAAFISSRARKDAKAEELEKRVEKVEEDVETVSANLATHRENTARHRDPERDERTHREIMERFNKLETMLMRLMNKDT
ncbi:MAG: hypothetical protein AB1631_23510 [Acidobacteriota bacterium]